MSENDRKALSRRLAEKGMLDSRARNEARDAQKDLSLLRDRLRSSRTRLRWLYGTSGFLMISFGVVFTVGALYAAYNLFPGSLPPSERRTFLNTALGLNTLVFELGIIFKLYAHTIDLNVWLYLAGGPQGREGSPESRRFTRFLGMTTMLFIALATGSMVWGLYTISRMEVILYIPMAYRGDIHDFVRLNQVSMMEQAYALSSIFLLMSILSLTYLGDQRTRDLQEATD